jgi:hypothetical protein
VVESAGRDLLAPLLLTPLYHQQSVRTVPEKLILASNILISASIMLISAFKMSIFVSRERAERPMRDLQRPTRTIIASRKRLPASAWTQIVFKNSFWCPIGTDRASSGRGLRRFNQLSDPSSLGTARRRTELGHARFTQTDQEVTDDPKTPAGRTEESIVHSEPGGARRGDQSSVQRKTLRTSRLVRP